MKRSRSLGDDSGAISKLLVFIVCLILLLGIGVTSGVQVNRIAKVDSILTEGAKKVGESIRANGCVTENALNNISNFLTVNGVDPSRVFFNASSTREGYGSTAANGALGYNYVIKIPLLDRPIYELYREKEIPNVQSEYVAGMSADTSPCVGSFANFSGVQKEVTDLGPTPIADITNPSVPTSVVLNGPSTVIVGQSVEFTGTVEMGSTPAPQGTQVTINSPTGSYAVNTQSNGTFKTTVSFPSVGNHRISAVSGLGNSSINVSVVPSVPTQILFTNAGSESNYSSIIGTSLSIKGLVTDANGNPIPSTSVSVSSNTSDVSNQAITTDSKGAFSLLYTPTKLNSHEVTFSIGSIVKKASVTVHQGSPKEITLESSSGGSYSTNPLTVTAGDTINFRGKVLGPYNSAITGANITLSSSTNGKDNFMPNGAVTTNASGEYSNTGVTLTLAGTHYIHAVTGGLSKTAQVQVKVLPSVVNKISNLQVSPQQIGAGSTTIVTGIATDAYGNPVEGVELSIIGPDESTTVTTRSGGIFNAELKISTPGTANVYVKASGETLSGGIVSVNVLPTGAYNISIDMPTDPITAGSVTTAKIALKDNTGAPVPNKTLTLSLTPEENALIQKTVTTNSSGEVTITTGTLTKAGYGSLTATMDGVANVIGTATFEVVAGAPAIVIANVSPSVTEVWTEENPVPLPIVSGTVTDSYANPVSGANLTVSGRFGATVMGESNTSGFFDLEIKPTNVGGPFTLTCYVLSRTVTKIFNIGTITVTTQIEIPVDKVLEGTIIAGYKGTLPNKVGSKTVITPGPTAKVIPKGYYGGAANDGVVAAVNVPADKVLAGTTIAGTVGTMPNRAGNNNALGISRSGTTLRFRTPKGYYDGIDDTVQFTDPNFVASNIVAGKTIFGLTGIASTGPKVSAGDTFLEAHNGTYLSPDTHANLAKTLQIKFELGGTYTIWHQASGFNIGLSGAPSIEWRVKDSVTGTETTVHSEMFWRTDIVNVEFTVNVKAGDLLTLYTKSSYDSLFNAFNRCRVGGPSIYAKPISYTTKTYG